MGEQGTTAILLTIVGTVVASFGWMLKFVLQENAKREANYQRLLKELTGEMLPLARETHGMVRKIKMKVVGEG